MTKEELNEWYLLRNQLINGYHMEPSDTKELIRLNHLVMEASHYIHNKNMTEGLCNCGAYAGFHEIQAKCK